MKKYLYFFVIIICTITVIGCDSDNDKGSDNEKTNSPVLKQIGRYKSGAPFDEGGTEISAYDPVSKKIFSTNGDDKVIDIIDLSDPTQPIKTGSIDPSEDWSGFGSPNSVSVNNGIVAVAAEHDDDGGTGKVMFYDTDGAYKGAVDVGILPDMVIFTPDGTKVVVANEGEPYVNGSDQIVDPEGSVSVIVLDTNDLNTSDVNNILFNGKSSDTETCLRTPLQTAFAGNAVLVNQEEHRDFEPEYVTVSDDSTTAYISLQENNGIAVVDLTTYTLSRIYGLGYKDHSLAGNGLDAKEDGTGWIETVNLRSLYMPDTLGSYSAGGTTYIVTANEGDSRALEDSDEDILYADNSDDADGNSIDDITITSIDPADYPDLEFLVDMGTTDNNNYDHLYLMGARSFSIWNSSDFSSPVFDSGDDFESVILEKYPDYFNSAEDDNDIDSRSPKSGPEPEALTVAAIGNKTLAFIGLEKFGGIMVYDITDPYNVIYMEYITNRDFSVDPDDLKDDDTLDPTSAGDLAPEGMLFVPASDSPNGMNLLIVSNEVSGTITIYRIDY